MTPTHRIVVVCAIVVTHTRAIVVAIVVASGIVVSSGIVVGSGIVVAYMVQYLPDSRIVVAYHSVLPNSRNSRYASYRQIAHIPMLLH